MIAMKPYQERVTAEKQDLDGKIERLSSFLNSTVSGLPTEERDRMNRQLETMMQYAAILGERIAAFPKEE